VCIDENNRSSLKKNKHQMKKHKGLLGAPGIPGAVSTTPYTAHHQKKKQESPLSAESGRECHAHIKQGQIDIGTIPLSKKKLIINRNETCACA